MPIVEVVFPILLIAACGYLAMRCACLNDTAANAVADLAFKLFIPALLFVNTATMVLPAQMPWHFLVGYYLTALLMFLLAAALARWRFGRNTEQQAVFGIGACYSNIVIVGLPICSVALGEASLLPLFLIVSVHNLALFTLGIFYAEHQRLSWASLLADFLQILRKVLTTPITAALVSGGIMNLLDIGLYAPLQNGLTLLGQAAVPVALFVLGTSLYRYRVRGHLGEALSIAGLKIVLFPGLVYLMLFHVMPPLADYLQWGLQWDELNPLWAKTAVMVAAMPVAINAYIFSQKYQQLQAAIASAIFLSTLACILTLSVLISLL